MARPSEPVFFNKLPTAALADGEPVVLPRASTQVDYEGELVAVVGMGGRHILPQDALRHVAAYCCGNDISRARLAISQVRRAVDVGQIV